MGVRAFRKKKHESEKTNRRVSSLRQEFTSVKQESYSNEDNWIERKLDDNDSEDELMFTNRR